MNAGTIIIFAVMGLTIIFLGMTNSDLIKERDAIWNEYQKEMAYTKAFIARWGMLAKYDKERARRNV